MENPLQGGHICRGGPAGQASRRALGRCRCQGRQRLTARHLDSRCEADHDRPERNAGREDDVLELYHNINSVCAQKVRIALREKGEEAKEHLLTLRGDQNDPAYLKINPNGVVPSLVHDGHTIIESSLILYYLDEAFPDPPLMPQAPALRHRVRLYNKLIDEYVHNSCTILTYATAFRPNFLKLPREVWLAQINKGPLKRRAEYKRSVIEHGLDSEFVSDALAHHQKLLSWMDQSLQSGPY